MPDVEWNTRTWDGDYDWSKAGEEWSGPWGSSEAQWYGSLYPRLHRLVPTGSILEIAPGFGRWSRFLIPACAAYLGVDLSQTCVDACRSRFAKIPKARFVKNNGLDLPSGENFDLVFSFDSLVHADFGVLSSYVPQILSLLTGTGTAFIHHSNAAALGTAVRHHRSEDVSADLVAGEIQKAGGRVVLQEILSWDEEVKNTDTITVFSHGPWRDGFDRIENALFTREAQVIRETHLPYCGLPGAGEPPPE